MYNSIFSTSKFTFVNNDVANFVINHIIHILIYFYLISRNLNLNALAPSLSMISDKLFLQLWIMSQSFTLSLFLSEICHMEGLIKQSWTFYKCCRKIFQNLLIFQYLLTRKNRYVPLFKWMKSNRLVISFQTEFCIKN